MASFQLRDIRAAVARKCDDCVEVVATTNSSDTSVLIDALSLYENDDHFRGSDVWFKNDEGTAANRGLVVRCTSSNLSNTSMSLGSGLATAPQTGDIAWVFNIGGMGNRVRTYDSYINDAIRSLGRAASIVYTDDPTDEWDVDAPWVDIPDEFTHVRGIQYYDTDEIWKDVPGHAIAYDIVQAKFTVSPEYSTYMDDKFIRIIGLTDHPELEDDTDTTDVHFGWLTNEVAGELLLQRRDQVIRTLGGQYKNYAMSLLGLAAPMALLENAVRIR